MQVGYHGVCNTARISSPARSWGTSAMPARLQQFRLLGRLGRASSRPLMFIHAFNLWQALMFSEVFKEGEPCQTSLPKGFQGGIRRHNFKLGLMTHGSKSHKP